MSDRDFRRELPSVERLASGRELAAFALPVRLRAARQAIDQARRGEILVEMIEARAVEIAAVSQTPTLRRAINATGVILHTNLGRATLAPDAAAAVAAVAASHASLETDEETGGRGSRQDHVEGLLCELTGAEAAFVVNNNAAATYLAIASLAAGQDVILSRGELVEIGGHFRLPDVIQNAGARLIEVGTTNRTRIADYAAAITDDTRLLLRVHPSNYRVVGFTEAASLEELVQLGKARGVPVGDDIGSGALVDFSEYGLTDEPLAPESIRTGADIVWFSGDKLLGGPQAGILVGKRSLIQPMTHHPLARAFRPDKLTLAALAATLRLYANQQAWQEIPTLRRIRRSGAEIQSACERIVARLPAEWNVAIVPTTARIGGGSLPGHSVPSFAVAVSGPLSATELARRLRAQPSPIYGRIERELLLLDLRAVDPDEEQEIIAALANAASRC